MVFIYPRVTRQMRRNSDLNVFQALLAAVQCKAISPRRNGNISSAVGGGGVNKAPRKISGLGGTPSSYSSAGRHSSAVATRSGQRSLPTVASGMLVSDRSPDCSDTIPNLLKRKISSAESVTDGSPSRVRHSCPISESFMSKNSVITSRSCLSIAEMAESEKDVESCLQEESNVLVGEQANETNDNDTTTSDTRTGQSPSLE